MLRKDELRTCQRSACKQASSESRRSRTQHKAPIWCEGMTAYRNSKAQIPCVRYKARPCCRRRPFWRWPQLQLTSCWMLAFLLRLRAQHRPQLSSRRRCCSRALTSQSRGSGNVRSASAVQCRLSQSKLAVVVSITEQAACHSHCSHISRSHAQQVCCSDVKALLPVCMFPFNMLK